MAPLQYVEAPACEPRPYGLFSVAPPTTPGDNRWEAGIQWEPLSCGVEPSAWPVECDPEVDPGTKGIADNTEVQEATPFVVYASYSCAPIGRPFEEAERYARERLTRGEERAVERLLMTGAGGAAPSFQGAATPAGTAAQPMLDALSALEGALASTGCRGVIHVPASVGPFLGDAGDIERLDGRLETLNGTYVALGAGYEDNVGPDGSTPAEGTKWLYATGLPEIRRSEIFVPGDDYSITLDRDTNEAVVFAERVYVASWECVTAAVLVEL